MSRESDHPHHVRRVVLPSGKTIEVVYFDDQVVDAGASLSPSTPSAVDLHCCGTCASELVYPVEWDEAGPRHWDVTLRCPNCEWTGSGVFDQEAVERFDEQLDQGTEALVRDLRRLIHANMEEEIGRFVAALHGDHIQPEDF